MAELTITEQVYLKMKADIVCGKYEIVKDLPAILELCELFHVGRNTMRHALRLLEEDGLIKQEKGRNARVIFDLNKRENRAMYEEMLYGVCHRLLRYLIRWNIFCLPLPRKPLIEQVMKISPIYITWQIL
ncbi:GntR family transcriptional regulator [Absiella sp. AM54-8XD]|uniref:winged helix-turn-helix domain-containing protein n=1 Tax=Absiella sp. AM54-8XD TaxID=2292279 RepID=UPI000E3F998E|nr:winged helix-turn-helix domain-containing protein [Absiella sp. AM54-8XD]RGC23697.1 GntR family transcriptional regulator [Absiella sp. AM54-8XD]